MEKTANRAKQIALSVCAVLLLVAMAFGLAACGEQSLYKVDFSGTIGEQYKHQVAASTWTASDEEGFEKVYTLTGTIARNTKVATDLGYTDGREHFVIIHFSSKDLARVAYDDAEQTGFYAKITNKFGTNDATEVVKHSSFGAYKDSNTDTSHDYYLFQGLDDTVRTLTIEISFDGTEANARLYKFVIDPENYTLEAAAEA